MNNPEDIDQAFEFCASIDPDFVRRSRGASADEIAEVEQLLQQPMSPQHRRFLELLGASVGGLDLGELDTSAVCLAGSLEATYGAPVAGYELFAVGQDEPFEDVYLIERGGVWTLERLSSRVGTTHATLRGDAGIIEAGSIAELMCLTILRQKVIAEMPRKLSFALPSAEIPGREERPLLDECDRLTEQLGLTWGGPASATTRIAANANTVVIARQGRRLPFQLTLASYSRLPLVTAARLFMKELGLERLESRPSDEANL